MLDQRWDGPARGVLGRGDGRAGGAGADACTLGPMTMNLLRRALAGWARQRRAAAAARRRWRRLALRGDAWQAWACAGVNLAVAQRRHLRRKPLPWPFCVAIGDDLLQTWPGTMREPVAKLAVLAELMELHTAPYAAVPAGTEAVPDVAGHRPTAVDAARDSEAAPTLPAGAPGDGVAPRGEAAHVDRSGGSTQPARGEDSGSEETCDPDEESCECDSIFLVHSRRGRGTSPAEERAHYAAMMTGSAWPRERSASVDEEPPACDCRQEAAAKMLRDGPPEIKGRLCWTCPRVFRMRCLFFQVDRPGATGAAAHGPIVKPQHGSRAACRGCCRTDAASRHARLGATGCGGAEPA